MAVLVLSIVTVVLLSGHHTVPVSTPSMAISKASGSNNQSYDITVVGISVSNVPFDDAGMMIDTIVSPLPISHYKEGSPWVTGNFTMYYVDVNQDSVLTAGDRIIIEFAQKNTASLGVGVVYRPTGGIMGYLNID